MDKGSDDEDLEHVDLVHTQPIKGRGIAATLALLKGTKDLERKEELSGRTKDSRVRDLNAPVAGEDEIKLEYRDSLGRLLTQKEAYRQLCYNFHGYGAGKAKTEKRLRVIGFVYCSLHTLFSTYSILILIMQQFRIWKKEQSRYE